MTPIHPDTPGFSANDWLEVSLVVASELAEPIAEILGKYVFQGVIYEPAVPIVYPDYDTREADFQLQEAPLLRVVGYLPTTANLEEQRQRLEHDLWPLQMIARAANMELPAPTYTPITQKDWGEVWKQHYKPVQIGKRLMVVPAWESPAIAGERLVVQMDPGQAFGTGTHPSTQLCMVALETEVRPGMHVLDLGCGSGILAIAAARLGAERIDGFDIEQQSVKATLENAARNGVEGQIRAFEGSVAEALAVEEYDLAVVNILAKVIIMLFDNGLARTVKPGGRMILAGILQEQAQEVIDALQTAGMRYLWQQPQLDWVGIIAERPLPPTP